MRENKSVKTKIQKEKEKEKEIKRHALAANEL
jgi:hypothetical protein